VATGCAYGDAVTVPFTPHVLDGRLQVNQVTVWVTTELDDWRSENDARPNEVMDGWARRMAEDEHDSIPPDPHDGGAPSPLAARGGSGRLRK
jgi:hypothetical protein